MSYSSLATARVPAYKGNYTEGRGSKISEITIHHMSGKLTARRCGELFQAVGREGSSHYGIGYDGEIANYVDEADTAWTNSNWESNCRAVTIEVSNSKNAYPWPVSDASLNSLIRLVADIAKRNGLGTLVKGKNLTWHRMYAATDCPGDYLLSKMDYIVAEANKIINAKVPNGAKGEIAGTNINRGTNQLIVYNNKATTGTNQWGYEVAVDKNGIALSDPQYKGNTSIPSNGFVLSGHGTAGSWIYGNIKKNYIVKIVNDKVVVEKPKTTTAPTAQPKKTIGHKYNGINVNRGADYLVVYKNKATTGTNQWGYEVPVDKNGIVLDDPKYKGNTSIPNGGFVISGHGNAANWIYDNIKKGYYVSVNSDGNIYVDKWQHYSVDGVNTGRGTGQLIVYNTGANANTNSYGYEVAIDRNGYALANPQYIGKTAIPSGGFVISGHLHGKSGSAGHWVLENIKKGTKVKFDGKVISIV